MGDLFMGYQPRTRIPRTYRRRQEKGKDKPIRRKRQSSGNYLFEEKHIPTSEEVADRTLNRLRNLGDQRFALPPFSQHFNRWLMNLRNVLSECESTPTITVDDQFLKEKTQILVNIELDFEERRRKEASLKEIIGSLSEARTILKQIEGEYVTRAQEVNGRQESEIGHLSSEITAFKEELGLLAQRKTRILDFISKKARAQKETETTQKLNSAQKKLTVAIQHFKADQEKLQDEYERRKQPITEQIRTQQKEIEAQEIDESLETRCAACEALINALKTLLKRRQIINKETDDHQLSS